jgi:DNA-binding MarR family transcriptional regulator
MSMVMEALLLSPQGFYITSYTMTSTPSSLGTLLRQLLERLDRDVERAYRRRGLAFKPRYTTVVRQLIQREPLRIGEIVAATNVSQPSVSATIAAMERDGLVSSRKGEDGRERLISLTSKAHDMLPALQEQWIATATAAHSLDRDLSLNLEELIATALAHLDERPFIERMLEAGPNSSGTS